MFQALLEYLTKKGNRNINKVIKRWLFITRCSKMVESTVIEISFQQLVLLTPPPQLYQVVSSCSQETVMDTSKNCGLLPLVSFQIKSNFWNLFLHDFSSSTITELPYTPLKPFLKTNRFCELFQPYRTHPRCVCSDLSCSVLLYFCTLYFKLGQETFVVSIYK